MSGTAENLLVPSDQLYLSGVIHLNNVLGPWLAGERERVYAFMKS